MSVLKGKSESIKKAPRVKSAPFLLTIESYRKGYQLLSSDPPPDELSSQPDPEPESNEPISGAWG